MQKYGKIKKISPDLFTWQRWRKCDILSLLNCFCVEYDLIRRRKEIIKYSFGYCDAKYLLCRPKANNYAVMFFKDDIFQWFHLTKKEFNVIFK